MSQQQMDPQQNQQKDSIAGVIVAFYGWVITTFIVVYISFQLFAAQVSRGQLTPQGASVSFWVVTVFVAIVLAMFWIMIGSWIASRQPKQNAEQNTPQSQTPDVPVQK